LDVGASPYDRYACLQFFLCVSSVIIVGH
jgi:hypothetical protein